MNNPLQIQLLTNLNCNLACSYCYEHKGRGANDAETMKRFVSARMVELVPCEPRDVIIDFIGGESLLYPALLDEICEFAAQEYKASGAKGNLIFSLSTNGTLIAEDEEVRSFILKWRPNVGISIDGTRETHDACRVDAEGAGSYERAAAGFKWLAQHRCPRQQIGVKATYCHKTIRSWGNGVINLIELGFREIAANVVFEEIWDGDDAVIIFEQMRRVVDYLFERGLEDTVHIFQINNAEVDMRGYQAQQVPAREANHCGSCAQMLCLGFDGLLYGCNRFCTMAEPIPIGRMNCGHIEYSADGEAFKQEVRHQYQLWPEECRSCGFASQCPSCAAIPYEHDGPRAWYARKPQCGFTHAMVAARLYFQKRLLEKEEK